MRLFLVTLILLMMSRSIFAQGGFRVGVKGGYNATMLYNTNLIEDPDSKSQLSFGYVAGVSTGFNAYYFNYGFTLGFFLKQYTQKWIAPTWESSTDLKYFEVPFLFRLRPVGNKMTRKFTYAGPYFEIGIQPGYLSASSQTIIDSLKAPLPNDNFENMNISGVVGFGYHQVGIERWAVTHGLRFTYGFLDIITPKITNGSIFKTYKPTNSISAGYLLSVSYKFPYKPKRAR